MLIDESLYVGQKKIATRKTEWHNQGTAVIRHAAYCCPTCGEIWARRIYHAPNLCWSFHTRPCESDGDGSLVFSELEWDHILYVGPGEEHRRVEELYYPIEWLAYELFLILRRSP